MSKFTKAFLYTIYFLGVVSLSTAIALSFRSGHAASPTVPAGKSSSQRTPSLAIKPTTKAATPSQSSATSPAANQSTGASSSSSSQLTNTGPGDTVGLFVVVSISAATIYRYFTIRRLTD